MRFNRISGLVQELAGELIAPVKLWRRMRDDAREWLQVLGRGPAATVRARLKFLTPYATTSSRKKNPSTLERLQRASTAAQQIELTDPLGYLREKRKTAAERSHAFASYLSSRQVELDPKRLGYQRTVSLP